MQLILHSFISTEALLAVIIFIGLLFFIIFWSAISSGIREKKIAGNAAFALAIFVFLIIVSLITVPLGMLISRQVTALSNAKIAAQKRAAIPPNILPYPGGEACTTSKATGASASRVIALTNLATDGKNDMYKIIQLAIDEAGKAGGGVVRLPAGTFVINGHLEMKNNVRLEGAGPTTILKAGPNFIKNPEAKGYSIIAAKNVANVTIAHLTADQQGNNLDGNSINRFLGYVIHAYRSTNVLVDGVYTRHPFAYAIVAEESKQFCFKNNNTQVSTSGKYDQLDGIHVLNSSYGDVLHNYVDQGYGADGDDALVAHTIDGTVHDITYAGNTARGGKGGAGMQLALTNAKDTIYNIKVQNNEFWGSPRGIRTGYYGEKNGSVHDVLIGGSAKTGNYIHDNIFNNYNVGDTINIYGNGDDPYNITVTYNKSCKAGSINVGTGKNILVAHNKGC